MSQGSQVKQRRTVIGIPMDLKVAIVLASADRDESPRQLVERFLREGLDRLRAGQ